MTHYRELLACTDEELARVDPIVMNLLVAKGIPALADLDIPRYVRLADNWTQAANKYIVSVEWDFRKRPEVWHNDIDFFRAGNLCQFIDRGLGVRYIDDQREVKKIKYTNPSDLFLNGVMDRRRGTCMSMSLLHMVLGRRLGWPVSLACVGSHQVCRYVFPEKTFSIETTTAGGNGFGSPTEEELIEKREVSKEAIDCGCDLRALNARELLGLYIGMRARHLRDSGKHEAAELDCLLSRHLFPNSRKQYIMSMALSIERSLKMFGREEVGSPESLANMLLTDYCAAGRRSNANILKVNSTIYSTGVGVYGTGSSPVIPL